MNFLLKSFYFIFVCLTIQSFLISRCSTSNINEDSTLPIREKANAPNGPVDLPADAKLKMGTRKFVYHTEIEDLEEDAIEEEIKEDMEKIQDSMSKTKFALGEPQNISHGHELNYDLPPWLIEMINLSNRSKDTLETLGVENLPHVDLCKNIKHLKEQMLCIVEALDEIKTVYENAKDITSLTARVLAGGRLAIKALARLKTLASDSQNKQLMKAVGTPMATLIMLQRETTSDRNRWMAGSILTLLTDLPVISDLADIKTGSHGHVNVIMPRQSRVRAADRTILRLREGASPSSLANGYTTTETYHTI